MDMAKVLAVLAQPREKAAPLEQVERLQLEIAYITKKRAVETRPVRVVMPKDILKPMPLVYVPHYEMGEDSVELRDYLAQGWAVACPDAFSDSYNGALTDDDLVFNNAALYALRHRPEFDMKRIVLAGGSAGAYMTLMLNGLQLGLCASVANGPVPNLYFNFYYYWQKAVALNQKALAELPGGLEEKDPASGGTPDVIRHFAALPIPFIAGLAGLFLPNLNNFPDKEDYHRWEELSPIGLCDCFSSPIIMNHSTSDVLVPVDQLTRKFTYKMPGESLPPDFNMLLPQEFPGRLGRALDELLPAEDTRVERITVPAEDHDSDMIYDSTRRFNINIYDDGPPEGYGTHSARLDTGRRRDIPYLKEMLERTASQTCQLTPAMLKRLLLRYQGRSIPLPPHEGVDDTVYGSLAVYRQEIVEELSNWIADHGMEACEAVLGQVMKEKGESSLEKIFHKICSEMRVQQ